MKNEAEPTKITKIIQREDGSQARIVATVFFGTGLHPSIDVYVHKRQSPKHAWVLCCDRPHPDWRTMSVDQYIRHGRSQMLQTVSHAEILKVTMLLRKWVT